MGNQSVERSMIMAPKSPNCPVFGVLARTAYVRPRFCRCPVCKEANAAYLRHYREVNREELRAKARISRQRFKESFDPEEWRAKERVRHRQWREKNPEKVRAAHRRKRMNNPDASRARVNRWAKSNPEKKKAAELRWAQNNPDKVRLKIRRRRARRARAAGTHTAEQVNARIVFYGSLCYLCRAPFEAIDHVIPLSRGGSDWPANLRPICTSCNSAKGAKMLSEFSPTRRGSD